MSARVFVFGADAMDPQLIHQWIGSGHLPNLARLRDRGRWSTVLNETQTYSAPKWASFCSGVTPARHGQRMLTRYDPNTCVHWPVRPASQVPPFWNGPGWRQKRTAILNVPFCAFDESINGLQVVDWSVHDRGDEGVRMAPAALRQDVLAPYEDQPFTSCMSIEPSNAGLAALRQQLIGWVRRKRDVTRRLLAGERWDLFVSIFDEAHCAGHLFWCLQDSTHPRYDPEAQALLRHALRDVYAEIDATLGEIVADLDSQSTILFLSSESMGPSYDGPAVLDEILRRLDGLPPRAADYEERRAQQLAKLSGISEQMPRLLQRAFAPGRRWFGRRRLGDRRRDERRRRRCFALPTQNIFGGIRINLAGREASGIVQPGAECETFIERLAADLHRLRDGSGAPIVAEVVRAADAGPGCFAGEPPDLIVRWAKQSFLSVESPKIGQLRAGTIDSGHHDPRLRGLFVAAGPHSPAGALAAPVRMEDFAAMICGFLDIGKA